MGSISWGEADGSATEILLSIISKIKKMMKIGWGSAEWDDYVVGEEKAIAPGGIRLLFDADMTPSASGISPFLGGVGPGDDLRVIGIEEDYMKRFRPIIRTGYFYLGKDEYYLFAKKQSWETGNDDYLNWKISASGTIDWPIPSGYPPQGGVPLPNPDSPIIVRKAKSTPQFGIGWSYIGGAGVVQTTEGQYDNFQGVKTYEYPMGSGGLTPTPDIFRVVIDDEPFTGVSGVLASGEVRITVGESGVPHFEFGDPVPTNVIVESESPDSSGFFVFDGVDLNPIHSVNTSNKMLIVTASGGLEGSGTLTLRKADPYPAGTGDVIDFIVTMKNSQGMLLPNQEVWVECTTGGATWGRPVRDDKRRSSYTGQGIYKVRTKWDGSVYYGWELDFDSTLHVPSGVLEFQARAKPGNSVWRSNTVTVPIAS